MGELVREAGAEEVEAAGELANGEQVIVSGVFSFFAREVYEGRSPLYHRLASTIAEDPQLLAMAAQGRKGTALPNLFLGAIHLLLLKGAKHPLSAFYPSISGTNIDPEFVYPYFRSFVLEHKQEIIKIISTRLVQTNEVGRCACFLPAFELVARQAKGRPLALVDVGASAGLNLFWDRYGYEYGEDMRCGNRDSPVQINCSLLGENRPPISDKMPEVGYRVGIDLNPVDLNDPESVLWLRALVWPEHRKRAEQLQAAINFVRRDPPRLIQGDALDLLPTILDSAPDDQALVVYHSLVTTFLQSEDKERLRSTIADHAQRRPLYRVSLEHAKVGHARLELTTFVNGVERGQLLAYCHSHGESMEWLEHEER